MSLHPAVRALVESATADVGFSGRVLLTTIFGDALLPRRQPVAVVQLAELVDPIGMSDRLVRTSLLRLTRENLVTSERRGRLSFYSVHPEAEALFTLANGRIYADASEEQPWDGEWTVAVIDPDAGDKDNRARCVDEFAWLGAARITPSVHASPTVPPAVLRGVAARLDVTLALLLRGPLVAGTMDTDVERSRQVDPDGRLAAMHATHASRFEPLLDHEDDLSPGDAFVVRTLLIDSWRRIALRSPLLPTALLPSDWAGASNLALTERLHGALHSASEAHIDRVTGTHNAGTSLFA